MKTDILRRTCIAVVALLSATLAVADDSIPPSGFRRPLHGRIGAEISPAYVPGTNAYLKGNNWDKKAVRHSLSGALRYDFSFDAATREGLLYRGLYQGIGVDMRSFFAPQSLGTPVSVYLYQGAPFAHFGPRLSLGYEWKFGIATGWDEATYPVEAGDDPRENLAVSTPVTAYMGISLKLNYRLSAHWQLLLGLEGTHFSNGNTKDPNQGVNSIGISAGVAYDLRPQPEADRHATPARLAAEADRPEWFFDLVAYGSWRRRAIESVDPPQFCPGKFGVAGIQFAPMRTVNRWLAAGVSLDLQYDESAGLPDYWVEGTSGEDIKFFHVPFGKQLSAGLSAHAELTMPIFSVNAGLGYDVLCPTGNEHFYQSLTLKTFVSRRLFLNVGYRLGNFRNPQNLLLGLGVRL